MDEAAIKRIFQADRAAAADCALALAGAKAQEVGHTISTRSLSVPTRFLCAAADGLISPQISVMPVISCRRCAAEPMNSSPRSVPFARQLGYGIP